MSAHQWGIALSGICAALAVIVSAALIQQHMAHFSKPNVQSKIVGILWMVPIYSVDSWLSLSFKDYALYLDMFRDCYEAYVLYLFLALLVAYLGDGDEQKIVELLEQQPRMKHFLPFKLCLRGNVPHGAAFLKFCKFGTMQYIVLKPSFTLFAVILSAFGVYGEGTFALNRGWVYQVIVMNVSVGYAFYCLGLFYIMLHTPLEKHNPVPKFLCIKAVLFLSFWQGVIIAGLARLGIIHDTSGGWTRQNIAQAIQDLLICVEMMMIAFCHRYAFPYEPYVGAPSLRTSLLEDHFAHSSAVRDFNEVMPVLLPGKFKPGLAQTFDRSVELEAGVTVAARQSPGGDRVEYLSVSSEAGWGREGNAAHSCRGELEGELQDRAAGIIEAPPAAAALQVPLCDPDKSPPWRL